MEKDNGHAVQEKEALQYTTINHKARKELKITLFEYCTFDSIYHLSNNPKYKGWCIAGLDHISDFIGCDEKTVRRARERGIEKGLLKIPKNKKGVKDNRITTTQLWYNTAILDLKRTKCPDDLDKMSTKQADDPDKMSNYNDTYDKDINNDNVMPAIVSSFNTLKIPNKDRTVWLNQHKDNLGYLLKQLRYAIGKRDIKNIVKWLQSALDGDYAGCDNEAIEARELSAETDKERENNEASALSREAGVALETGGQFDERADSLIKTLNRLLVEREGKTDIVQLCKELKHELESGKNSDEVEDRFFAELIPLMKRQSVRT